MKLRNKKTGEIGNLLPWVDYKTKKEMSHFAVMLDNRSKEPLSYNSLAELNEEWEDYEEPEFGYIVDPMEEDCICDAKFGVELEGIERAKELGIWFKTEEEAEKAIEKLKAWKRLQDAGFRFTGISVKDGLRIHFGFFTDKESVVYGTNDDLDLLFGGEDE